MMDARPQPDGLVTLASADDFQTTLERLTRALNERGVSIFAVIDHAAGAHGAGLDLRPTTVVIFGDPRAGTPLMQAAQTAGIDLPLKMLVWRDAAGFTQVSYNDPAWIARRNGLDPDAQPSVARMSAALSAIAAAAVGG
jgi:uncharacterized protein (DUF302 family)